MKDAGTDTYMPIVDLLGELKGFEPEQIEEHFASGGVKINQATASWIAVLTTYTPEQVRKYFSTQGDKVNPATIELLRELAVLSPEEIAERFASEYMEWFTPGIVPEKVPIPPEEVV